jgi:DNA-binding response OmpR family regulator
MTAVMRGGSVLFVDDEQPIRDLFGRALIAAGIECDGAADGNKALFKLGQRRYDAVVIDIIMPDREGVETIVEIRKRWPETFIIAISGGGRVGAQDFLNLAAVLGADRTLTKPFTPAKLLATLAEGPPQTVEV